MFRISSIIGHSCLLLAFIKPASAQSPDFSVSAGAGISGLKYSFNDGNNCMKPGFQATFGYTWFMNDRWGIGTGMGLDFYQAHAELTSGKIMTTNMVDTEGEGFEHRLQTTGYKEKQKLYTLSVPLVVQFQTPASKTTQWYIKGGFKLAIPLSTRYSAYADEVRTSGYYPDVNLEVTNLPSHGFGKQPSWSGAGSYTFNPSISTIAETGAKFKLPGGRSIYAGVFIDYGLNNIKQDQETSALISYNYSTPGNGKANGIFSLPNTTGNVHLMAYGIRLGYSFHGGSKTR